MRLFLVALFSLIGLNIFGQTNLQYQAHVPFRANSVEFSAYLADSSFNESSHINTTAFWYTEGQTVDVNNGIIDFTLQNIPDSIFGQNQGNLFVYAYVNGQSLGRLPVYPVPYARFSNRASLSQFAANAENANFAETAGFADTAGYAHNAGFASRADSSTHAVSSDEAAIADVSVLSRLSERSVYSDSAETSTTSIHSTTSDTATYAYSAGSATVASSVVDNGVTLAAISGGTLSANGAVLTNSGGQIGWVLNPQHYTNSYTVVTSAPVVFPQSRWVVSRVAVNYNLVAPQSPVTGQLVTIYNGSTSNRVILNISDWNLDIGATYQIGPGLSKTLVYDGAEWIIIE